jgi:phosphoribosyl 1,2-cyclic phosphate phosphodiesterase
MDIREYVRFLGTGAGDYHCESHNQCDDELCSRALRMGGRNIRHSPSLFISPDIIIDFGVGTASQLSEYGIPADSIHHVFISHSHYDHCYPEKILNFASGLSHQLNVYGNNVVGEALAFAASHRWDPQTKRVITTAMLNNCRFHKLSPEKPLVVGDIEITPVLSSHMIDKEHLILTEQGLNFIFERSGKSMFYNLDSSYLLPETLEFITDFKFDIVIMDATFGYMEIEPLLSGHHNFKMLEETLGLMQRANSLNENAAIIYTHISTHAVPPHDEIVEDLSKNSILLAYDGMIMGFGQ